MIDYHKIYHCSSGCRLEESGIYDPDTETESPHCRLHVD